MSQTGAPEKMQFKTELSQLLDIIVHSLYSHREIFLRELISNACDAIDKVRFESLTRHELVEGDDQWRIDLIPDKEAGTLTVRDNGIGMSRQTIVEDLGTIARSGTKAFIAKLKEAEAGDRPELIGQFGVGFYASFMVADKVTVRSRQAGTPAEEGAQWVSDGKGEFEVESIDMPRRGTEVVLHLREDCREFLDDWRLKSLVKKYSDFVEHPIVLHTTEAVETDVTDDKGDKVKTEQPKEETLNSQKAIWLRPASELEQEDYNNFYRQISHDFQDPARTIHFTAEGMMEFKALLFIPSHKPMDMEFGEPKSRLQLYIRRVFINDQIGDILTAYLRFVRGVVEAQDLPLNVSREMLQSSAALAKIRKAVTNRILKTLSEMQQDDEQAYLKFYEELGVILKEGLNSDYENREKLAGLLMFESTRTEPGKFTTLDQYLEAMPEDADEIYYIIGEHRELIENSPYLESIKAEGREVLLLTDPVDEFVVQALSEYKGKQLKAANQGDAEADESTKAKAEEAGKTYQGLMDLIREKLDAVKQVRVSTRLRQSAVCLVSDEGQMSAHMERLMRRLGRDELAGDGKRIMEINPEHPVIQTIHRIYQQHAEDARLGRWIELLYDQAVIAEGSKVKDPAAMADRINQLMLAAAEDQKPDAE